MRRTFRLPELTLCIAFAQLAVPYQAIAQDSSVSRIARPIDEGVFVTLKGNIHPLAMARYDKGAVADSLPAERLLLLLKRSPEKDVALQRFLQDAHTPGSSSYHQWLTPVEFANRFGPDDADVSLAVSWLASHGFSVARVSGGKTAIEFSGSAGQLREAFHTQIHTYIVNGEEHYANSSDPQIPAALAPLVAGITPMNNFPLRASAANLGSGAYDLTTNRVTPAWTLSPGQYALAPGDFAIQYDLNPVHSSGTNGAGVSIGIISDSNIDPKFVAAYRSLFHLPASAPRVVIDGADPGQTNDAVESYLDVEIAGSVAPAATVELYAAASTNLQGGLNLAALRAVDDDAASVLSTGYGLCEQSLGAAGNKFWAEVWEQAAAQGQTPLVSSGASGSAGCDDFDIPEPAKYGLAVNGISSTPWNIAVGGTDFFYSTYNGTEAAQGAQLASFWKPAGFAQFTSLQKRVPEQTWNESFGLNLSTGGIYLPGNGTTILAGGGGASSCITGKIDSNGTYSSCSSGYAKPVWQAGTGVPADGVRDIPDISLFAGIGSNDSFYPICQSATECVATKQGLMVDEVGGTSTSVAALAGIFALIDQKFGRQGQADFRLYALAAQHGAVFHGISIGSNDVPCAEGSPDCSLSAANNNTKGTYTLGNYSATHGYDQASGLGSIDVDLLLRYWNLPAQTPTSTALAVSQTRIVHGSPVKVTVGVSGSGGTPGGQVALVGSATPSVNIGVGDLTLNSGAASGSVDSLPGGKYKLTARYGGDGTFASSISNAVTLNVTAETSATSVSGAYYYYSGKILGAIKNGGTLPFGYFDSFATKILGARAPVDGTDGVATGTVEITDTVGTIVRVSGPIPVDSGSVASWRPSVLSVGAHTLVARYSGDLSFDPSTSAPFKFTIVKATPTLTFWAVPNSIAVGDNTQLFINVGVPASATAPTGSITFYFGKKVLGKVPVIACASGAPLPCSDPSLSAATLKTEALPVGSDSLTAVYSGDVGFSPVTSEPSIVTVSNPPGFSASITPAINYVQEPITIVASIPGIPGKPKPTGVVDFYIQSGGGEATVINDSASYTFSGTFFTDPGTYDFQVVYRGDSVYAPAQTTVSATTILAYWITGANITISSPGATKGNASSIAIQPANGFTGVVNLSCAISPPVTVSSPPTCTIAPSVNLNSKAAVTTPMTITSTGTPPGTYAFVVTGVYGPISENASIEVAIQ